MRSFPSEMLEMVEGCAIEISYYHNIGFWYKAIIEAQSPAKPKASVRLLNGFSTSISELNNNPNASFRPVPPKSMEAHIDVKQGSIVDVVHKYGWWTGTVVKEIEDDKFLVSFESPPDIIQFERKLLRPHLEWVDEKSWVIPGRNAQLLKLLKLEPMFCPGALVEVKFKIKKTEVVWVPAIVIKEIEEDDVKKYIVKFCNNPLSCKVKPKIPNKTIALSYVRPRPAPLLVEDYLSGEDVEVFHGSAWRQGTLKRRMNEYVSAKLYLVCLEATKQELSFKNSDIRPMMKLQEDGIWKQSRETPLTQASGNKMVKSMVNAKGSDPPVSASPDIAATLLKQTETETQRKSLTRNQNGLRNDLTPENENNRDNDGKRTLQDLSSLANVKETEAKDIAMVLPVEKKLPIWNKFESMKIFKTVPQSPHFSPLAGTSEDSSEVSAVRRLNLEPMFCPEATVEVRCKINAEVVWVPAVVIKEIEEDDKKKYLVKFCSNLLRCKGNPKIHNKTFDLHSVRPRPAPFWVEDYIYGEDVEVFYYSAWRQGRFKRRLSGFLSVKWFVVLLKATKEELNFKHSDNDEVAGRWHLEGQTRETPSTRGLGNKKRKSVMNAKESDPLASASPDIAATPLKRTEIETQRKPIPKNQNGLRNDSAPAKTLMQKNNIDNDRKRKREEELQNLSYVATVEEANDTTMVLPFEKKLPIWKKFESMEIFKTVPQSPHFSPLVKTCEDSREVSAVGLMLTFSSLLEEVKDLQLGHPRSSLISINASFAELEKHGFNVKTPRFRISKLLSLRDMQTKKLEELKDAEKVTAEKESIKAVNERKILELQTLNLEADNEIAQSKSCEATIVQQLEDVKFQFQTTALTPW